MLEKIQNVFQLPISYSKKKKALKNNIIQDLELTKVNSQKDDQEQNIKEKDHDNDKSIYKHVFSPSHCFGDIMLDSLSQNYTTDVIFLKDTQTLIKKYKKLNEENDSYKFQEILDTWNEIKNETGFCEKYLFIDWDFCKFLNNNSLFLQIMSIYNLTSPILSLFMPIFILIIPFFIIKLKGLELTMNEYFDILKKIACNHAIGKVFTQFQDVDFNEKIYLVVSLAFYIFSIYQNILICIRFYSNIKKIHNYLYQFQNYIKYTLNSMDNFLIISNNLKSYSEFNNDVVKHKNVLIEFKSKLDLVSPFKMNISKVIELGNILHSFYQLHSNINYEKSILYSFGFNGYINNIEGLQSNINNGEIKFAKIIKYYKHTDANKSNKMNSFKHAYYPALINKKPVKNTYQIDSNFIITGPNASGKTTLLKTTLINIILSQQFGCGCYSSANITPYDNLHCYLNIPDTSGRDSLFQAEARRCKEIIDDINKYDKQSHFCIFDEIYSGTNPDEATISAIAFIEYIAKHNNLNFMLTTHYVKVCKQLSDNKRITNFNMKTYEEESKLKYTYQLVSGISEIKGGFKVLKDMNYPIEIINKTNLYISNYNSLS